VRILAILVFTGMVGGDLLLESHTFQEFAIRTVVRELNKATGGRTEIGNVELQSSTLTIHLYNITLHGGEDPSQSPLLHVDKITLHPKIRALLYRKLILDEVLVEHPVVHTSVDHGGKSNVPQPLPRRAGHDSSIVDLSIRHLLLSNGEITYENKKTPLSGELYDLGMEIRRDPYAKRYSGHVSYRNARLQYLNYASVLHSLNVTFNATSSHILIESARATVGSSTVLVRGEMQDFSSPKVEAEYEVRIHTDDFRARSSTVSPIGDISLAGRLHYKHAPNRPLLLNLAADGQLGSDSIQVSSPDALLQLRSLYARYQLANGALQARGVRTELLGGQATVDINIQHLETTPAYQVTASLDGISLQAAQQAIQRTELKRIAVYGMLDGTARASWIGTVSNLISRCDLRLQATANSTTNAPGAMVPIEGAVHVSYNRPRNILTFQHTTLHLASTTLAVKGEISDHSNLEIDAAANDLHQLVTFFSSLRVGKTSVTEISGSAVLKAMVNGPRQNPRFIGQLSAQNLVLQDSRWSSAKITFQVSPSQFIAQNALFVNANQGKVFVKGSVGLRNWEYLPANPTTVSLSIKQMRLADLQSMSKVNYPVSGELSAEIDLHGSELDPIGSGSAKIIKASIYDEPLENLVLEFHAENGWITSKANIGSRAGSGTLNVSYAPANKSYNLSLNAPAIALQELHAIRARNLPLRGMAKAALTGQGTLTSPQLTAVIELPQAEFGQNSIAQLRAEARIANQRADLELSSRVAEASVQLHGFVNIAGDYYSEATLDTGTLKLDHLLSIYWPRFRQGFQAQTELHAVMKGPLKNRNQLEGHLTIPPLNATYESLQIRTADPIRLEYARSVLSLLPAELQGSGTSLRLQGSVPLDGTPALNLSAQGQIDAGLLRIIQPEMRSSGIISFDVRTVGSTKSPSVLGQIRFREFALTTATAPLGFDNVNGSLDIENNRVRISSLSGQIGGGQLSMAGSILYRPDMRFDVTMQTKAVRLRSALGLRMLLDTELALTGNSKASTLKGRAAIESLSFSPDFDITRVAEQLGEGAAPHPTSFADSVKLAVAVQSKNRLSATSSQATAEGDVNLQIIGNAANPVIVGRTDLTSGEFFYRSRHYQLQRGLVVFNDPTKTRPALDVSVTTTVQQYNLSLTLRGPLDRLTTSYASDPPLSTADIINLIAVGNTTQAGGTSSHGTDSILASQAAGQFSAKMQSLTGISSLRIDPLVGGGNRDPSARIAIQQRVTKNFLFTFSTDVSQAGQETVEGEYQINKRWSLGVARNQVGGISAEGRYHTKF
jgi:translocation and assembly module TamB